MYPIFEHTLKVKGKYSRRALTMFTSLILGYVSGIYIVISDLFLTREINSYAWLVVGTLLANGTGQAILLSKEPKEKEITQPETPLE